MRWLLVAVVVAGCGGAKHTPDAGPDACSGGSGCGQGCQQANDVGVGKACTAGGGQCGSNLAPFLFCTVDYEPGASAYCTGPCHRDSDCGTGAYCSGAGQGGRGCEPAICGGVPSVDAGVDAM